MESLGDQFHEGFFFIMYRLFEPEKAVLPFFQTIIPTLSTVTTLVG